ncbi:MAG: DUF192 domain-containing protein [Desulfobacteraceae bacterium]|nr:MAG: DUF192 domain-containing protein [Desulfobacteraceae bacterium]
MLKKQPFIFSFIMLGFIFTSVQIYAQQLGSVELFNKKTGRKYVFNVEIAQTETERSRGLMYRKALDPQAGMLFVYPDQKFRTFWMKNTLIALDLIFIDTKKRIVHIHPNAIPMDETNIPSQFPAQYVLEVNAGMAKQCGLNKGDRVKIKTP